MSALQKLTARLMQIKASPWKPFGMASTLGAFYMGQAGHVTTAQMGLGKGRIHLRGQFGIDLSRHDGP